MPPPVSGADIRTFLFADMRGYTRYTQEHGDDAASALARAIRRSRAGGGARVEGELLELRGDEALCMFRSARQALRASVEVQRRLRTATGEESAFPLGVGMGLDAGEAVPTQGGYRGGALNLAARLCGRARGGQILATQRVVGLTGAVPGVHWERPSDVGLDGVRDPERVVEIHPDEAIPPPPAPPPPKPSQSHRGHRLLGTAAAGLVLAFAGGLVWAHSWSSHDRAVPDVRVYANSVAVVDPTTGRVVRDIRVGIGRSPSAITVGFGAVWIANTGDTTVSHIYTSSMQATPIGIGGSPAAIAAGAGAIWAYDTTTGRI